MPNGVTPQSASFENAPSPKEAASLPRTEQPTGPTVSQSARKLAEVAHQVRQNEQVDPSVGLAQIVEAQLPPEPAPQPIHAQKTQHAVIEESQSQKGPAQPDNLSQSNAQEAFTTSQQKLYEDMQTLHDQMNLLNEKLKLEAGKPGYEAQMRTAVYNLFKAFADAHNEALSEYKKVLGSLTGKQQEAFFKGLDEYAGRQAEAQVEDEAKKYPGISPDEKEKLKMAIKLQVTGRFSGTDLSYSVVKENGQWKVFY